MSDKEVTLKLKLDANGFKKGMADAEQDGKKKADSIGKGLSSALSKAGKEGIDSLKSTLSGIKSAITGFAGIAGGLGVMELGRRALASEAQFRKLAFQIKAGTGALLDWRAVQKEAQKTALDTGHTTEEVAKSISDLYAAVGDPKFAREASRTVATVATGSHESIETITAIAGTLNEKFGITSDQLGDTLADVISLGNKGGVSVEDMADKIGLIGANARGAGLDGQKGFKLMVGMLNIADNATGTFKKGLTGVSGIIEGITNGTMTESLKKNLKFDLTAAKKQGLEFDDILGQIIEKSGGSHDNLAKVFAGDQLKVVTELAKVYQDGFDSTTGTTQEKTRGAWAAYEAAITDASKSALTLKDLEAEKVAEMETPEKKIATALERLAQTFTDPAITDAFKQLADFIPKVINQMIKHPLLTGALMSGVPQAIAGSLVKSIADAVGGGLKGLFSGGMGGAPAQLATTAAVAGAAYVVGREIIDRDIAATERRQDNVRAQGFETGDMITNSRTMRFKDPAEALTLAAQAQTKAADLDDRIRLARVLAKGKEGIDTAANIISKQRREGRGSGIADFKEAMDALLEQGGTDKNNIFSLMQSRDDARQASLNFREKGTTYSSEAERIAGGRPEIGIGAESLSDIMGGGYKSNRQRKREAQAAEETKSREAKEAKQAQDFKGLATAISSQELKVRITNPEDIKADAKPTPGPEPR